MTESRSLPYDRLGLAEHKHTTWFVVPEFGTSIEDVLDPGYWIHVTRHLRPCDEIKVYAEDGSWRLLLHVASVGRVEARVDVITRSEFGSRAKVVEEFDYEVKYRNPHHRYAIIKRSNGEVVKAGFQTQDDAIAAMREHAKTMMAA